MANDEVFSELFDGHYDRVFFLFRRKGLRLEEARDLTQETFVRVYKGMTNYRGDAAAGYVVQVAENVWKNHLRYWAAESRAAEEVPVEDSVLSVPDGSNVIQDLVDHERKKSLEQAIEELPTRMQRALRLWLDDLRYLDIAAVMNVSLDTVKSLVYQGKKRLQDKLGETDISSGRGRPNGGGDV